MSVTHLKLNFFVKLINNYYDGCQGSERCTQNYVVKSCKGCWGVFGKATDPILKAKIEPLALTSFPFLAALSNLTFYSLFHVDLTNFHQKIDDSEKWKGRSGIRLLKDILNGFLTYLGLKLFLNFAESNRFTKELYKIPTICDQAFFSTTNFP